MKSQTSRCRIFRTVKNAQVSQKKLLVAKNIEQYQEVCLEIPKMLTEQSITHEEGRRTSSTRSTSRIIARN